MKWMGTYNKDCKITQRVSTSTFRQTEIVERKLTKHMHMGNTCSFWVENALALLLRVIDVRKETKFNIVIFMYSWCQIDFIGILHIAKLTNK